MSINYFGDYHTNTFPDMLSILATIPDESAAFPASILLIPLSTTFMSTWIAGPSVQVTEAAPLDPMNTPWSTPSHSITAMSLVISSNGKCTSMISNKLLWNNIWLFYSLIVLWPLHCKTYKSLPCCFTPHLVPSFPCSCLLILSTSNLIPDFPNQSF